MVKSMTGFGRGEYTDGKRTVTVEIKAVNHRFSDISVKMPRRLSFAEDTVKALVKGVASRGKIDVSINVEQSQGDDTDVQLNLPLAMKYYEGLSTLKEQLTGVTGDITVQMLSGFPDVIKAAVAAYDEAEITESLTLPTKQAVENFDAMRIAEGQKLVADILYRNDIIEKTVSEIEVYAPSVAEGYKQKMKERISELVSDAVAVPEERILLEAAIFADKSNITEELVRLKSHVAQLRSIIANAGEPVGKKLDFLVQEMNREANTIGSKANDIAITNNVLVLKSEIEKIREQVQNIE